MVRCDGDEAEKRGWIVMRDQLLACLACVALTLPSTASSAEGGRWTVPRTEWGDPDLRGIWPLDAVGSTPMQRRPDLGAQAHLTDEQYQQALENARQAAAGYDREDKNGTIGAGHWFERGNVLRQTSLIMEPVNGRVPPMTSAGLAKAEAMHSSWDNDVFEKIADFNSLDRCITRGMPASMIPFPYNNGVEVFQAPGYVVLNLEMIHETRIVPLDGRPKLPASMRTWLGESRGHWEGDTLVIETTNFNGESPMVIVGPSNEPIPTSPELRVLERLTPTGPDSIHYEAWIEDPTVLTAPFKLDFPWTRNDDYGVFEYACHEGNTLVPAYIRATSPRFAAERDAGNRAREGL
jgi:hypothetical protein